MEPAPSKEITRLLRAWEGGDRGALERLTPLVYGELHRMALHYMGDEKAGITLQPTALVNEAYLRLVDARGISWHSRAQFFAISAGMMRHILVDAARARGAGKRGGGMERLDLNESIDGNTGRPNALVALERRARCTGSVRPAQSQSDRAALLRRPERGRDGGGAEDLAAKRDARLEAGSSMADEGNGGIGASGVSFAAVVNTSSCPVLFTPDLSAL